MRAAKLYLRYTSVRDLSLLPRFPETGPRQQVAARHFVIQGRGAQLVLHRHLKLLGKVLSRS